MNWNTIKGWCTAEIWNLKSNVLSEGPSSESKQLGPSLETLDLKFDILRQYTKLLAKSPLKNDARTTPGKLPIGAK